MTEPKHTPGPWGAACTDGENGEDWHYVSQWPGGIIQATDGCGGDLPLTKADAHLIAAAPEMLEALKALERTDFGLIGTETEINEAARKARVAIAKAKGRS